MTNEEHRRQRVIAKAVLERLEQELSIGLVAADVVEKQREIVKQLRGFVPTAKQPDVVVIVSAPAKVDEKADDEVLHRLRSELSAIDHEKTRTINILSGKPVDSNQIEIVSKIKGLRDAWVAKSDEIYYYLEHGEELSTAPPEPSASADLVVRLMENLPRDKFTLNKRLLNLRTCLSKYRKRHQEAKTDVQRAHQQKNITQAELEIKAIDQLLSSLI